MLATDVGDKMTKNDKKNQRHNEKSRQHNDSVTNIFGRHYKITNITCHQHHCHQMESIHSGWP